MVTPDPPRLSIIVPVYNVEEYLPALFSSLRNQTRHWFECIVVDDGSTDESGPICDELSKSVPNCRVIHQRNGGRSAARNAGLLVSSGEYVTFLDGDDTLEHTAVEVFVKAADAVGAGVVPMFPFAICSNGIRKLLPPSSLVLDSWESALKALLNYSIAPGVCAKVYRRVDLEDIRFPTGCEFGEDLLFNAELILKHRVVFTAFQDNLYNYVQRSSSISHNSRDCSRYSKLTPLVESLISSYSATDRFIWDVRVFGIRNEFQACLQLKRPLPRDVWERIFPTLMQCKAAHVEFPPSIAPFCMAYSRAYWFGTLRFVAFLGTLAFHVFLTKVNHTVCLGRYHDVPN